MGPVGWGDGWTNYHAGQKRCIHAERGRLFYLHLELFCLQSEGAYWVSELMGAMTLPIFGIPVFGIPDFGIPGFGNLCLGPSWVFATFGILLSESLFSESLVSEFPPSEF